MAASICGDGPNIYFNRMPRDPTRCLILRKAAWQKRIIDMDRIRNLYRLPAFHGFLACLGFILFSWPIVTIVDERRGEAPFIYLFTVWALLIILMYFLARSLAVRVEDKRKTEEEGTD